MRAFFRLFLFSLPRKGFFRLLRRWERFSRAAHGDTFFAARSSFSLPEKEERPAGVEEKEGFLAFGLRSNISRCRTSFRKALLLLRAPPESRCNREKLRAYLVAPKWSKQYLPHPLAAAALLWKRMRKNFQIAALTMIRNLSIRSSPEHRKAAAGPLFLCTGRDAFLFSHEKKEMGGAYRTPCLQGR